MDSAGRDIPTCSQIHGVAYSHVEPQVNGHVGRNHFVHCGEDTRPRLHTGKFGALKVHAVCMSFMRGSTVLIYSG